MITKKKNREELQLLRDEALDAYLNREDFQFDVNADALYQQYKDHHTQLGKRAMTDTVGKAAALTGGYGSSYAQKVGQQAYQSHLKQLDGVIPELYQLAYDRYQDESKRLYRNYQAWARQEQEAAQQERWEQEYALSQQKLRAENARQEQERKNNQTQTTVTQPDYYTMLAYHQNLGKSTGSKDTHAAATADEPEYDNGNVSKGNIKTMQRVLGLQETGKWTEKEHQKAGNLNADDAWLSYQKGQLQNRNSHGQWEQGATVGNIKTMERLLGLEVDGYWSKEDQKAAGGMNAYEAWQDYQQGKLQGRSRSGMSMEEWSAYKNKQTKTSAATNPMKTTSRVQNFIAGMMTKEQASNRGITAKEWEAMVIDRLNSVDLSVDEFEQLEQHYGLAVGAGNTNTSVTADSAAPKMPYTEYRQKTAAKKVADLNTAVQRYFDDYQLFANSAASDIQFVRYDNAVHMLETRIQTAAELRKRADTLVTSLETGGDILSGDHGELLNLIASTQTGVDSVMDFFDGYVKYYSQWDNEEAFNRAVERERQYYDNWGRYVNADDFAYYSAKGAAIQNPTMDTAERNGRFLWWEWDGGDIGNIVTYSRENAEMLAIAYANGEGTKGNYKYRSMKDVEVDIYNYLLGKGWEGKAREFLSFLDDELNAREGAGLAEQITGIDIPVVEDLAIILHGLGAGIDQWISGTRQLFTNELQPITITQYANAEIANSLDGFAKYAYTGANVIGNMAPSILLSSVTAGFGAPAAVAQGVGAATVGMSAAGNAYGSALADGYSVGQARAYSTLVGAAEGTLQYILGGIGALGGVTDDLIKAKINMIDNSLLRVGAKLGIDVFSEISEEELQNFLEPAFRSIIFGEAYDAPTIDEMIETAVVTAGTTIFLGGGDTVSSDLSENRHLNATGQTANDQANALFNQADIAKRLMAKGFNPEKSAKMADAIAARLNGQELTRIQTDRLRSAMDSAVVRDVMFDITKRKADGIDSVQNNVYDNVKDNEKRYEAVTADAAPHQVRNASSEGTDGGVDGVITDGSHLENGKLKPNVTYKSGEHDYFYTTNEDGLIVNARTEDLQLKDHEGRHKHNPNTYGKESGDHAGHLFGDRFGGSPELDNLVSQAKNVNLSEYKIIENQWANALKNGQKVRVNIDVHYDQGGVRPSSFDVSYTIDDVYYYHEISN